MENNWIDLVNDLRIEYENAKISKVGIEQAKTRYANALITHGEELILSAKEAERAEKQMALMREEIEALNAAIADADAEIAEMKAQGAPGKKKKQRGGE